MNQLFASGHQQLFDTQCSGLSAAWRRAAEESTRQPVRPSRLAALLRPRGARRAGLAVVVCAGLFAAVLASGAGSGPDAPGGTAPVAGAVPAGAPPRLPA